MKIKTDNTVFVFDLDDTLYYEADYRESGFRAVAKKLRAVYKVDAGKIILDLVAERELDVFGGICKKLNLDQGIKESLIWEYRLHQPAITLHPDVADFLETLKINAAGLCILTDGRSITQRLKLNSLGLGDIPSYISEEYGSNKPDAMRFKLIEKEYPDCAAIYIGDNPCKDFLAPNAMGWKTFGVLGNGKNIHSQEIGDLDTSFHPHYWLSKLTDLRDFLC